MAVLDELAIPWVVIVGHSMGGSEVLLLALHHSERVSGLALCATKLKDSKQ